MKKGICDQRTQTTPENEIITNDGAKFKNGSSSSTIHGFSLISILSYLFSQVHHTLSWCTVYIPYTIPALNTGKGAIQ